LFCTSPIPPTLLLPARETSEPAPTVPMGFTFPYCLTAAVQRRPDFLGGEREQGAAGRDRQPGRRAGLTLRGNRGAATRLRQVPRQPSAAKEGGLLGEVKECSQTQLLNVRPGKLRCF